MKIAVMGAGSVGALLGARLQTAGNEVYYFARGKHLRAMKETGLLIKSPGESYSLHVNAAEDPSETGIKADITLFCVKSYDTEDAAQKIKPLLRDDTAVITIQNGLGNEETLSSILGKERIMPAVIYIASVLESPGVINHVGGPGKVVIGEFSNRTTPRIERILEIFNKAGIPTEFDDNWMRLKFKKYIFICGFNALTAIIRGEARDLVESPPLLDLYRKILNEGFQIARKMEVPLEEDFVEKIVALTGRSIGASSSMRADIEAGKPLEADALNGKIVEMGKRLGVPTPYNEAVYAILNSYDRRNRYVLSDLSR